MLIQNLQNASCYPHPVTHFHVIETHISWVILTGEVAYKIKKPVNFGFLDFSTLEQRKFYCEKEWELGQTFSAQVYLAVVPIYGSDAHPQLKEKGPILEYAIKMKQFPQEALLSQQLEQGKVNDALITTLADQVVQFHRRTPIAPFESHFGTPEQVHAPVLQNFEQMLPLEQDPELRARLNRLREWSTKQFSQLHAEFKARKDTGFIRDCHGDLHLANLIFYENQIILFDRIEFNEDFRWTDVMADVAFLMMDLTEKGYSEWATQLLNDYLVGTGDYQGLAVLPYYFVYRAIVRAKIALFRKAHDRPLNAEEQNAVQATYLRYLAVAEQYADLSDPQLVITHGLSGAGKTTQASHWAKKRGAIHLRSDIVRKQLFNLAPDAQLNSPVYGAHYRKEATDKTYQALHKLAESALRAGYSVVVDACFLTQAQRSPFHQLATRLNISYGILESEAPIELLKARIQSRHEKTNDASESRIDILEAQIKVVEPLTALEQEYIGDWRIK